MEEYGILQFWIWYGERSEGEGREEYYNPFDKILTLKKWSNPQTTVVLQEQS